MTAGVGHDSKEGLPDKASSKLTADSDRGRLDPHQAQVEVELGAVVDLVLLEVIQDPVSV
jgi:hypothetical protein